MVGIGLKPPLQFAIQRLIFSCVMVQDLAEIMTAIRLSKTRNTGARNEESTLGTAL